MSYDIDIMRFENPSNPDLINWKRVSLGSREDVIGRICRVFPEANFDASGSGTCERDDYFLEFYISTDPCDGFMLSVRGGGSAIIDISTMMRDMDVQAFDPQSDTLFDPEQAARDFGVWQEYRDSLRE